MKKSIKGLASIAVIAVMTIVLSILFSNKVFAWMPPTLAANNSTGVFPQVYLQNRTITLAEDRWNYLTQRWQADITGGNILCGDQGKAIRSGHFDPTTYYASGFGGYPSTFNAAVSSAIDTYRQQMLNKYAGRNSLSVNVSERDSLDARFNRNQFAFLLLFFQGDMYEQSAKSVARNMMSEIQGQLAGVEKPTDYEVTVNPVNTYHEWSGDPNLGPQVGVMETGTRAENGYEIVESGEYTSDAGGKNAQVAYVLSVMEDVYGTGNYTKEYNEEDIQTAFWMLVDPDGIGSLHKLTAKGRELYQKSVEYAQFLQETSGGYKTEVDTSNAQIIVNQGTDEYIVGPFTATYPDYEDISYIKSIYLTSDSGILLVDEQHQDFEVICKGTETEVPGSNGITKIYPKSGEPFFIKFSAAKLNYPNTVQLHVQTEHIAKCSVSYEKYDSKMNVYRYIGYTDTSGEYAMLHGTVTLTANISWREYVKYGQKHHHVTHPETGDNCTDDCWNEDLYRWESRSATETLTGDTYQPYVKMDEDPETTETAQPLPCTTGGYRQFEVTEATGGVVGGKNPVPPTTIVPPPPPENPPDEPPTIILTFELGGTVWVDKDGGKESIGDSHYGSGDTPMSGVPVYLYREDGTLIATSTTDANGNYAFANLNAMYKYYVKFRYNAQYYEPVQYVSPYNGNWTTNSNGTDVRSERLEINARFQTISASPDNYTRPGGGSNTTYTRDQLEAAGAIDQFGNLTGGSSSQSAYVVDCQLESFTGNGSIDLYPVEDIFVIDYAQNQLSRTIINAAPIYEKLLHINQGYKERQDVDLALKKDVEKAILEINGKTHVYEYDKRSEANDPNYDGTFDIDVRISDGYYSTEYSRELYKSDYAYKVSQYGENYADYGKDKDDELRIFVTYKLTVRNQSMSIRGRIDEIVDYYDADYTFVPERSYIQWSDGSTNNNPDIFSVGSSKLGSTPGNISGYNKVYVTGGDRYLNSGEKVTYYLTYEVNKTTDSNGENWIILDEELESGVAIGVGKENIAEINRYSTIYADGTQVPNVGDVGGLPAGLIDVDSNPGNVEDTGIGKDTGINDSVYERFEDDSDKAPNIRIILYRDDEENRVIQGTVWEDDRNVNDNSINRGTTATGDGIRDEDETKINGVTVQLVEIMDNGTEFVWREFGDHSQDYTQPIETIGKGTGSGTQAEETPIINVANLVENYRFTGDYTGQYVFKSFMPGNYVVRYIYGDTVRTVLVNDTSESEEAKNVSSVYGEQGLNAKSYNGHDYKSTTYQAGLGTYDGNNTHASYVYDIARSDATSVVSDAKDLKTLDNINTTMSDLNSRAEVIDYSDNDLTNHIAEVLASYREQPSYNGTAYNQTQVQSLVQELMDRTKMTAETGTMNIEFEYNTATTGNNRNNNQTRYVVANVDLGLEERPRAQLAVEKEVTNVRLTLANGTVLFDAETTASNVLWQDHKYYQAGYNNGLLDGSKFSTITAIRNLNSTKFGLIQLTMDEELMHGATIRITYNITVRNVGEADYNDDNFYYTGVASDTGTIVRTTANQVIDYIANNLQFYAADNSSWQVISQDDLLNNGLVNTALTDNIAQYNTIISTSDSAAIVNTPLVPNIYKERIDNNAQDSVSDPLVLTQLITAENDTDDLTYRNIVEIVRTSNTVGRKNEYSVGGNQDPSQEPQEMDSDRSETVRILPPFGETGIYYIIAITIIAAVGIIIVGVIFIKKKVLKRKE